MTRRVVGLAAALARPEPELPTLHTPALVKPAYPAGLGELLVFADALRVAGYDPGPRVAAAVDVRAAIDAAVDPQPERFYDGLLDLPADEVIRRVRLAGAAVASSAATRQVASGCIDRLAADVADALKEASDDMITAMRPKFVAAMSVIRKAADASITATTNADEIVASGNGKAFAAFRDLPAAVDILNGIAHLRDQLTTMCNVGPHDHPVAAWLPIGSSLADLQGADALDDTTRDEVYEDAQWHFTATRTVPVHRCGGKWLALLNAGYEVVINDGPTADRVVAEARDAAADEGEADSGDAA